MENELITIATFNHGLEANIKKGLLENEGIPTFIRDENFVSQFPWGSQAVGGVKLQVRTEDAEKACELLQKDYNELNVMTCPNCGSKQLTKVPSNAWFAWISLLLVGIPFLFRKTKVNCAGCSHTFTV